ncbi:vWA domain-containing protein [Hyphomicrobium sp. 2TAF46]|uniref:vWA domain-containing protein n=1 Tax=Hyphomicrobium sp. 2TAF46 TaxID=3233019 RepID=UPI003F914E11
MNFLGVNFDRRMLLLLGALAATIVAIIGIHIIRNQRIADVLAIVDITGSMNTRDMGNPRGSLNRLEAARQALIDMMQDLPCQSRLGLGIFSERISYLLLDPVEICRNYDALEGAVSGLDWRMAWQGDSFIAKGLYSGIDIAASLKSDLIFLTDGHEAPPLPFTGVPEFDGKPGAVKGLIVGVGGNEKTPIPKYDDEGRQVGVYSEKDIPQDNRIGAAPNDAETREGYNPRNAPFGAMPATGDEQLSSVKTAHLQDLASRTGLAYVELQNVSAIAPKLLSSTEPRIVPVNTDMAYVPALFALLSMLALYALQLFESLPARRSQRRASPLVNSTLKGAFVHAH